jgi:hypothetical protein
MGRRSTSHLLQGKAIAMITYKLDPDTKTMEFFMSGKVTNEEYDKVMADFQRDLHGLKQIRILGLVGELGGIEPTVFLKDFRFMFTELGTLNKKLTKAAVVVDQRWLELMAKAATPFLSGEVRFFPTEHEAEARAWLGA